MESSTPRPIALGSGSGRKGLGLQGSLRTKAVLALFFCAVVPLVLLYEATIAQAARSHPGWHYAIDFHTFWKAGHEVAAGHTPYQTPAFVAAHPHAIHAFVYPAPVALAFAPLGALPYSVAAALFTAAALGALALSLRLLGVRDWRCYGAAFLALPVITSVSIGTLTPFLVLGVAALWRYRDRPWIAGAALCAVLVAKVFLWPLALWLLLTRRFRALAVAAAGTVVVTIAGWAAIGFAGFAQYPELLRTLGRIEYRRSYSLGALTHHAGLGWTAAQVVGPAAALLVIAVAARAADGRSRDSVLLIAALPGSLLAIPKLGLHYLALLLIPIAIVSPALTALWFLPVAFWLSPSQSSLGALWRNALVLGLAALVFAACLIRRPAQRIPVP